jgi:hypothetical protein
MSRRLRRPAATFATEAATRIDSPEETMRRLRRPSGWPEWQSEIMATRGPEEVGPGDHVLGDAYMLGFAVAGRADILSVDERGLEQRVLVGIPMTVHYSIERDGDGWTLTHRLAVDLPEGISGRVLSFFLKRRLRKMQRVLLANLGAPSGAPNPANRSGRSQIVGS